eukprot:5756130-Pyramimonas_sp.AAC.1
MASTGTPPPQLSVPPPGGAGRGLARQEDKAAPAGTPPGQPRAWYSSGGPSRNLTRFPSFSGGVCPRRLELPKVRL